MPINFDPNSLNSVFDKNFGAGAYNAGLSNAAKAARLKQQASFAKTDYLKRLSAAQTAAKKAATAATKKSYQDAVNYLNNDSTTLDQIKQQGAYKAAEDIKNDPVKKQAIKDQGYTVQDYIDAMYNAVSGGKYRSEREYNGYAGQLAKDTQAANTAKDKEYKAKYGMSYQDYYDQVQKPQQDAAKKGQSKQSSFADKAKSLALGAMDLIDRPGNAVRTGIKDAISGKGFLEGAKQGLLGQDHTSGVQLLQKAGLDPNNNPIAKSLLNGVATGLQMNPTSNTFFGMAGKGDNRGQKTAGLATEIALDPLSYLGARVPKVKPGVSSVEEALRLGAPQERLGLPAPQPKLNAPQLQLPEPTNIKPSLETLLNVGKKPNGLQNPIPAMPTNLKNMMIKNDLQNSWLDFGQNTKNMPKARTQYITNLDLPTDPLNRGPQYWQQRYEDFVKFVNDNGYTSNNLSHDAINELWTHFAKNNEPVNIDQVAELAYPKGYQAPPKPMEAPPQAPSQPTIKDYLNSDPRIKQQIQALFPNGSAPQKISRPATLDEMVQRLQDMTPPKQQPNPLEPLQFRKLTDMERQIKPGANKVNKVSNSPLLLNPNSLKSANVLKSTATSKTLDQMTKDELQTVYKQLQDQKATLSTKKTKASKKQIATIEEDLKKVNDFLMKSDLQKFGEGAKKKPTTGETITPREKKAQKKAVADFTDRAKKAGIDPTVRKAIQKTENVGAMLKGAKNINEMADKLPKEMGNQVKQSLKMVEELKKTKDILPTQTLTKNVYELADRLPAEMKNKIISDLDKGKTAHVNNMEKRSNDLFDKVVKGLGIEKGSKESALVQDFGEKTLGKKYLRQRGIDPKKLSKQELETVNLQQLKKLHPNDWQNIVKADEYLRNDYKKIIDEVNATVKKIYPTTYEKHMVKARDDYFHHFQELNGFEGFKNMVESSSAIDPHLAGISPYTQPKTKWQGFKQERKNGAYKSDAIGGYLRYLQASSYSTHIDPVIKNLRDTAEQIAEATKDTRNMNNIKSAIVAHADNLAGKTNPFFDRTFQDHVIGRKIMGIANTVNSHIKKNMILGNLGSALGQVGNVPLAIGKAKQFAAQGAMDTLKYAATHLPGASKEVSGPISKSQFLKERYSNQLFTRFDNELLKKPERMAAWLIETADKSGTYFTWNSMYRKGLSKGVSNPIKYADTETRHIVAGRGIGEIPVMQKSKIMQLVAPFSLEVGNQWKVLGKQVSQKDFAGIITFLAASYGLNEVMSRTKGSDVSYNPIGAFIQGINKDKTASNTDKAKNGLANLFGETVGNIPGGNYVPQIAGLINQQQKEAVFGDRSPDRFGTGLGAASTVFKPAIDVVGGNWKQAGKDSIAIGLPFGGNQAKKSWNGVEALIKGGAYNNQGKLQYPVDSSNPSDLLHSLMFGPTTIAQGRDYYNKKQQPLSANQTTVYQNAPNKQDYFNNIQSQRQVKAIQKKISDIQKDASLSPDEKLKSIFALTQLLQNMQK
jgi:hypothetical protein